MNLETEYLGLKLPHPLVLGASPLASNLDRVRRAEDAGAAAITLHSLFEEQLSNHEAGLEAHVYAHEESFAETTGFFPTKVEYHLGPEEYLSHLQAAKAAVGVPIIASLNGVNLSGWTHYAKALEAAGADALELNIYYLAHRPEETANEVESRLAGIVRSVCETIEIPVAVKLAPFFTSLVNVVGRLADVGAKGVVLFNRFYEPDIDLEELETRATLQLSESRELTLRLRWLALLYGRGLNLACTGGVHTKEDVIKALMAGADAVQLVATLLQNGVERLSELRREIERWMEEMEYESLAQMKGSLSYQHTPNPQAIERANYLRILQSWQPSETTV